MTRGCILWLTLYAACGSGSLVSDELTVEGQGVETHADGPCWDDGNRYVQCGNGTVTDTVTGLLWLQAGICPELPGVDFSGAANWTTAQEAVASLEDGVCGLTDGSQSGDWRLPTASEWASTIAVAVNFGCTAGGPNNQPSLTNQPGTDCFDVGPQQFFLVQVSYWSSTASAVTTNRAWRVDLNDGSVDDVFAKSASFTVWPVRDGR